ncbi:MAG: LysR family transcriptional regulator [Desulfobacteraceae bacterium]|nr:LysR family transcriptional regulator [Desulfobacteraceae bacterium]
MALTDEGTLMLEKAKNVLDSTGELLTHAEKLRGELIGKVSIGVNTLPEVLKITDFFKEMKNSYPRLRLKLVQSSSSRVLKYLKTEEFDGGYILGENSYPEINTISLHCLHLVVVAPASWESKIRNAGKADIVKLPWVIHSEGCPFDKIIRDNFGERNRIICRAVEADDETMVSLIYAGAGLGLMYRCEALAAQNEGKVAVWDGNSIETTLSFAYLKKRQNEPKIQAMLKTLRKIWNIPDYCCQV